MVPDTIGRYRVTGKIGEGGMGVVYAARDERLDRAVAIKMIREPAGDARARDRLWREARAAASVNHPNICQLYEVGEVNGELFLAMELMEGESLSTRLLRGPLVLAEAIQLALAALGALEALHRRGLVHRDFKPSNVFLTPHGVKLLDFGLARQVAGSTVEADATVTSPGVVIGTPGYMAPEQLLGQPADQRADLFAVGLVTFEMLAGKGPFAGDTSLEVSRAILYERPRSLGGSSAIAAVDRVIQRALAKKPDDRYSTTAEMAQDLRAALLLDSGETTQAHEVTRLIVLPLRILRPDPETDFLAFSLPDAIASTLSGLQSMVVRSSAVAARFSSDAPDLKALTAEADVNAVLVGSLLRAGEQVRVTTQLVEAPHGTILWSHTAQVPLRDIFELQDDLAHRIVNSLSPPLTAGEDRQLKRDVPASPRAYEFYLRANELGAHPQTWGLARQMYERCLEEDSRYAPAWARLGRIYRVLSKYKAEDSHENIARAEAAFRRALDINPDSSIAQNLSVYLEADLGRAQEAMIRLLERVRARNADPDLFAALVHTCRYCGLLEASVAAHERARQLDPLISTSVICTLWAMGNHARALDEAAGETVGYIPALVLASMGREPEAVVLLKERERRKPEIHVLGYITSLRALLEGRREESLDAIERTLGASYPDPEGLYLLGRELAFLGERDRAIAVLRQAVEGGFYAFPLMARDGWLDSLRADPAFGSIVRRAEERRREALTSFLHEGGDRLLSVSV